MLQRSSHSSSRRTARLAVESLEDRSTPSALAADGLLNTPPPAVWQPPPTSAPTLVLPASSLRGEEMAAGNRGPVDGDIILLKTRRAGEEVPAGHLHGSSFVAAPPGAAGSTEEIAQGDPISVALREYTGGLVSPLLRRNSGETLPS
jgi:hypothetical protein